MSITDFSIRFFILLIPGIISSILIETLTDHKEWNQFRFLVHSFVLGFTAYLFCEFIFNLAFLFSITSSKRTLVFWKSLLDPTISLNYSEIAYTCTLSVIQSFIIAAAIQNKWLFKLSKFLHVSFKYGDENLFSFFLNSKEINWVYVRDFKNNLTYRGLRDSFSETDKKCELVLTKVKVYRYSDSEFLYEAAAVYLSFEAGSFLIEIPPLEEVKNESGRKKNSNRGISKRTSSREQESTTTATTTAATIT